jgi:beta-phosphoglucomutase
LDGVLVSTDEFHYKAWKSLADEIGVYFDRTINERLRGVSRAESLEIILERAGAVYSAAQKAAMAEKKNEAYSEYIKSLTPNDRLAGVNETLAALKARGVQMAVGSSSKNARPILTRIGLGDFFGAVVDGNDITRAKPDPEAFLLAARRLGVPPGECLVAEDADAGVEAALRAGMRAAGIRTRRFASENFTGVQNARELLKLFDA